MKIPEPPASKSLIFKFEKLLLCERSTLIPPYLAFVEVKLFNELLSDLDSKYVE